MDHLPDFPRIIDIEFTNLCNFHCLMCPTGAGTVKRPKGFMTEETFQRILQEAAPHNTALRFARWGEPTIHPKWLDFLTEATKQGLLLHVNTNGQLLSIREMQKLVGMPLASIKFSFQGVDRKSYREVRNKDFFEELLEQIKLLYIVRGNKPLPFIHVSSTITYETPEMVKVFRSRTEPICDKVTVGRTIMSHVNLADLLAAQGELGANKISKCELETIKKLKSEESVVKQLVRCPEVFDKLSIDWDGTVSACCIDYDRKMSLGNLDEHSLQELWKSPKMDHYRTNLAKMNHHMFELCQNCYDFASLQTPGLQKV